MIQTGGQEIGILLTEKTLAYPAEGGSWTLEEMRVAFQAELSPERIALGTACLALRAGHLGMVFMKLKISITNGKRKLH